MFLCYNQLTHNFALVGYNTKNKRCTVRVLKQQFHLFIHRELCAVIYKFPNLNLLWTILFSSNLYNKLRHHKF